jgi:hypothetical protein
MAQLLYGNQFVTTSLNVGGGIDDTQTTGIILASTTGIDTTKPGICLINYASPLDTSIAEWVEYTSINGSKELVGVTRGQEGFSAKSHNNQVTIAFPLSESHINRVAEKLNGNDSIDADLNIGSTYNIKYGGADPNRTICLPAAALSPTTSSGCASVATVEAGTNDVDYKVLDFDQTSLENAFAIFSMPDSWDAGTITAKFIWTTAASSGNVIWGIKGRAFADDAAIDQAYGTEQEVTDGFLAAGDIHISSATGAMTFAGSPAGGQLVQLKIYRKASDGSDTLNGDARLIAVVLEYKQGQFGD